MKKKIIIAVALVVVIALGGTLVFAAVGEDGNLVNPFAKILSNKVEEGAITQDEVKTFTKVWDAIKGEAKENRDKMLRGKRPEINTEFMEEFKEIMSVKVSDVLDSLVSSGVLTTEEVENAGDKGLYPGAFMKDADDETIAAIKETMIDVSDYMEAYLAEKVLDGTLTQDQADKFLGMGRGADKAPGGRLKDGGFRNRMPGRTKDKGEAQTEPEA